MVRRFLALLALVLACAVGGGPGASASTAAPASPVAVTSQANAHSGAGSGHAGGRNRHVSTATAEQHGQYASGVSATGPHEVRPPGTPPAHGARVPRGWSEPPLTGGRVAERPAQERAPPSTPYSPRSTRGPPASTSS